MKTQILYIASALLLAASVAGCREENLIGEGEGTMKLETSIMSDVKVVSRSLTSEQQTELCNSALIWISDPSKGLLYKYDGLGSFPAAGLPLSSGHYAVEAWVGDSVPASWDKKRYRGYQPFEISRGNVTNVELTCPIRNTVVSVKYGDGVKEVLTDLTLTVSLNDGITDGSHSLTFQGETTDKGYYMLNSRTEGFNWTLSGKELSGKAFTKSGQYKDPGVSAKPFLAQTTEYVFNINYNLSGEVEIGGAYFSIDVEPEPVEGTDKEVLIALAPDIQGSGFDMSVPVSAAPGTVPQQSINITGSSAITKVEVSGSLLTAVGLQVDYELIGMQPQHVTELAAKGLTFQTFSQNEGSTDITNMRIIMSAEFFAPLGKGEYQMTVSATDAAGETSQAVYSLSLNDLPVVPNAVNEATVTYDSATLTASVKDASAHTKLGFEVRVAGGARSFEDWTFVEATAVDGIMTATVTGLAMGNTYEYRAVADDYTSPVLTFETKSVQLPNCGFEDWDTSSSPYMLYSAGNDMFWDSGNTGSATMNKNVTTPDSSVKHSGNYSVKLASQFVGFLGIGKFAAGNVFIGKYLATEGTDGVLGWGRPWEYKPRALKGYVKYKPKAIDYTDSKAPEYVKGDMDTGIIYIALLTDEMLDTSTSTEFPIVVKTKTAQLFNKNGSNVIAYGEKIFTETPGEGMVEFEIPINDVNPGTVKYIMCTASASKGGDYFCGGNGSTMWIDDLKLVY
ncbi:MAG: PCMD domain-containing protein [Muribaculaceae bacterium]|nr:PCMD domain-containing protein [Muribaculaceae bacterium]